MKFTQIQTIVCCVFVFLSLNLSAQSTEKKNSFGLTLGYSYSSISNYEGKPMLGVTGGLYWEWKFAKKIALQSYFMYLQRGENADREVLELQLDYAHIPTLIKYYPIDKFAIYTGISADILLNSSNGDALKKENFKGTDWAIPIGVSYDIAENFQLELMYNIGLSDVQKVNVNMPSYRNNWGSLTWTYIFGR